MIRVTVTIDFGPAGRQPFEAVVTVPEKSHGARRFCWTGTRNDFSSIWHGPFVEAIDGIKNDLASDRGWRFEVNVLDLTFLLNDIS